jgi:hypothetical protein
VPTSRSLLLLFASAWTFACDTPSSSDAAPAPGDAAPAEVTPAAAAPSPAGDAPAEAKAPEGGEEEVAEPAEGEKVPEADAAAEKPADAKPLTDAAIFVVRDKGIVVLTDDGFATIEGSESVFVKELARGTDGQVFLLGSSDIKTISGTSLQSVQELDFTTHGSVSNFAPDRTGGFWLTSSNGVVHIGAKGETTTEPEATFGQGTVLFAGIAVDENDQPWVATSGAVFTHTNGAWAAVKTPRGSLPEPYFEEVERAPDGAVFVRGAGFVLKIDSADAISKVKVGGGSFAILGDMAFSDGGMGVIRSDLEAVSVFAPPSAFTRYKAPKDFKIGSLSAVAADDQGRVWVTGEAGLAIVGPGSERVTWRSGSQEAIAGEISPMIVIGKGPVLPGAGEVKKGGLAGRVMKEGAGVAGLSIELCESPSFIYSRTPCSGAPTHLKGKTDAEGRFTFDGVPLGAYGVAVKVGRKWQVTMGAALGSRMTAGETYDIGDIELQTK